MSSKVLAFSVVESGHFLTFANAPSGGIVAASPRDMIDGNSPAATAACNRVRRFRKVPSGVISDGFIPVSNRLRMVLT